MLELLYDLCAIDGVSGYEDKVRDYIKSKVEPYADDIKTDAMGNLIVFKKGRSVSDKVIMLAAHMDEVGFIIKSITDEGYLKFRSVGGVDPKVIIGKRVRVGDAGITGLIGIKAYHLVNRDEVKKVPKIEDMYIDIGAKNKEEALKFVSLGDLCAFDTQCLEFGQGYFKAKAIDDRAGCAALIKIIIEGPEVDCYFVFTVQEEVGTRGAFTSAFSVVPDIALVVEGTTAADIPGTEKRNRVCSPGGGVVIPFMDRGTVYDREIFEILRETAVEAGIPWQTKQFVSGGTDAAAIQRTAMGVRVGGVAVAVRYIHSPASVAYISDFDDMLRVIREFLKYFGGIEND